MLRLSDNIQNSSKDIKGNYSRMQKNEVTIGEPGSPGLWRGDHFVELSVAPFFPPAGGPLAERGADLFMPQCHHRIHAHGAVGGVESGQ